MKVQGRISMTEQLQALTEELDLYKRALDIAAREDLCEDPEKYLRLAASDREQERSNAR